MWNGLRSGGFPFSLLSTSSGNGTVDVPRIQRSLVCLCCFMNHRILLIGASATAMCLKVSRHTISQPVRILNHSVPTYIPERNLMWSTRRRGKLGCKSLQVFGGFLLEAAVEGLLYIRSTRMRDQNYFLLGLNSAIIAMCVLQGWWITVEQGNYSELRSP